MHTSTTSWRKALAAGAVGLAILAGAAVLPTGETKAQGGPPGWFGNDFWMPGWMRHRMWRHSRDPQMRATRTPLDVHARWNSGGLRKRALRDQGR
jgi:hypothetical protein